MSIWEIHSETYIGDFPPFQTDSEFENDNESFDDSEMDGPSQECMFDTPEAHKLDDQDMLDQVIQQNSLFDFMDCDRSSDGMFNSFTVLNSQPTDESLEGTDLNKIVGELIKSLKSDKNKKVVAKKAKRGRKKSSPSLINNNTE